MAVNARAGRTAKNDCKAIGIQVEHEKAIGRPGFVWNPYGVFLIRRETENRIGALENVVGLVGQILVHISAPSLIKRD